MARFEPYREDLLSEARALVPRASLRTPGIDGPLVAGFRGEALSLYFCEDPVFHWNDQRQLRKAYWQGQILKAENGRLVALVRERGAAVVALVRHELNDAQTRQVTDCLIQSLASLRHDLTHDRCEVIEQVPPDGDLLVRLSQWLSEAPNPIELARRPNVH